LAIQIQFNLKGYYMFDLCGTSLYLHKKLTFRNFNIYNMEENMYAINLKILVITKDNFNSLLELEKKFKKL